METTLRAVAYMARSVAIGSWRMADRLHASRTAARYALEVMALLTLGIFVERLTRK